MDIPSDIGDKGATPEPLQSSSPPETTTTKTEEHASLSASEITPPSFLKLLACYPRTVEAVTRHRAIERILTPKGKKAREERKKAVAAGRPADELDAKQLKQVEEDVRGYLELDEWRYGHGPGGVRAAAQRGYLEGREVERLVEWKMKHGVHRPTLLGMVKSNPEKTLQKATREAFTLLSSPSTPSKVAPLSTDFPKSALAALTTPLRGIGPATASLLLSVVSPTTPFYSDDTYLWVCQGEAPQLERMNEQKRKHVVRTDGEIRVKYSLLEYEQLWGAVGGLRARLYDSTGGSIESTDEGGGEFLCEQIEKVAFVLRHIGMSGYLEENGLDLVSSGVKEMDVGEKKRPRMDRGDKKGGRNESEKEANSGSNGKRKREDAGSGGRTLRPRK